MGKNSKAEKAEVIVHRFKAPEHAGEVFLASGPKLVRRGIVTLDADAPLSDHHELIRAGFKPIPSGDPPADDAADDSDAGSGEGAPLEPPSE